MRRVLIPLLFALLYTAPAVALDICPWPVTLRGALSCPSGVSSAVCVASSGVPLTYLQLDKALANVVGLCAAEDRIVVTSAVCSNGDVPLFAGGGWTCAAAPPGPTGPTGPTGADGSDGATGPMGPTGPAPSGTANLVLATPSGSSGVAALRSLVAADIPAPSTTLALIQGTNANPSFKIPGNFSIYGGGNNVGVIAFSGVVDMYRFDGDGLFSLRQGAFNSTGGAFISSGSPTVSATQPAFGFTGDKTTGLGWGGSGVSSLISAGQTVANVSASAGLSVALGGISPPSLASPPCTCGSAGCESRIYYDTSHALCVCGASTWINLTPSDLGACN